MSSEAADFPLSPFARAGRRLLLAVRSGLFRPRCRICGRDLVAAGETVLCRDCLAGIVPASDDRCLVCGRFLSAGPAVCGSCLLAPPPFDRHRSYAAYEGTLRQAIILYKFAEVEPLKHLLAGLYLHTLERELPGAYDAMVPVPADRRRHHGFQPVRACGKVLARRLGIPLRDGLLVKKRSTPPQVGLTRAQRRVNLEGAFALAPGSRAAGLRLLLLDDVTTTGATLRRCAAVLRRGGARVTALTLAQTRL
ncbi:MAG TPA: ComF family protein [Candidatus Aminicenantes bacterium]|nr:ComF family protein [Candidatus Aminicenantes bacterium]